MFVLTQVFLFSNASEVQPDRFIPQYMLCCLNAFITRPHYSQRLIEVWTVVAGDCIMLNAMA